MEQESQILTVSNDQTETPSTEQLHPGPSTSTPNGANCPDYRLKVYSKNYQQNQIWVCLQRLTKIDKKTQFVNFKIAEVSSVSIYYYTMGILIAYYYYVH